MGVLRTFVLSFCIFFCDFFTFFPCVFVFRSLFCIFLVLVVGMHRFGFGSGFVWCDSIRFAFLYRGLVYTSVGPIRIGTGRSYPLPVRANEAHDRDYIHTSTVLWYMALLITVQYIQHRQERALSCARECLFPFFLTLAMRYCAFST